MDVQVRDAASTESAFVFSVFHEAMGPYVELLHGWDDSREQARHADRWGRQRFRIIVADGSNAGYQSTAVYTEPDGPYPVGLYLHQLMVLPAFQSKGIGAVCLGRLKTEARDIGLPLRLRALRVNPRALAFYLAAGCDVVSESDSHFSLQWSP